MLLCKRVQVRFYYFTWDSNIGFIHVTELEDKDFGDVNIIGVNKMLNVRQAFVFQRKES